MTEPSPYEIAHGDHIFCSPIGNARADRLAGLLELPAEPAIVDLCCGKAELLLRMVERHGGRGLGVDLSGAFIREGRERAMARGLGDRVELVCADVNAYAFEPAGYDLAMRIGGADDGGTFDAQVARLCDLARPGGLVLIADLYWRREPPEGRASLFAAGDGPMKVEHHAEKAAIVRAQGLDLLYSMTSTEDEWDDYEGLCLRAIERWAAANPDHPRRESALTRAREWYSEYLAWRRECLGFGFYLGRRPVTGDL